MLNGTSPPGRPAVEDKIYYCAGSCKSIVLERTIDRQQGQSNPNTTIKHIKLTIMHSIIKRPSVGHAGDWVPGYPPL
jgi:hypothetical protein